MRRKEMCILRFIMRRLPVAAGKKSHVKTKEMNKQHKRRVEKNEPTESTEQNNQFLLTTMPLQA